MFTGIIEEVGLVENVIIAQLDINNRTQEQENSQQLGKEFRIKTHLGKKIKLGSSLSVNGVCTTIIKKEKTSFSFFAAAATLSLTNLAELKKGDLVNLELALKANGTFDGHYVTGHVDKKIKLISNQVKNGNTLLTFPVTAKDRKFLIPKGSVTLNGISLTIFNLTKTKLQVMIIPFTWQKTNLSKLKKNDFVNLEFDILGKYFYNFYKFKLIEDKK